jgi:S-adenosylmethionine hydrolase
MSGQSSSPPIITLTTDFGEGSRYVAAMKGVILSINPAARLVDLSHGVPHQDVRHGAILLAEASSTRASALSSSWPRITAC